MHHNSSYEQRICAISVANRVGGSGLCCVQKYEGGVIAKKRRNFQYLAHSLQEKVLAQTNGTNGKCTLRRCAFWRSQPTRYQQTRKKVRVLEVHSIHLLCFV